MNFENLPENWKVVRLGRVAEIVLGKTPHRKRKDYWNEGTIPWVKIQDMTDKVIMNTSEKITPKAFQQVFHNNFIPKGTLLMSFKLTIGRTAFLGIDAVHNEAIVSIFPKENVVDKRYLFYFLPSLDYFKITGEAAKGETLNKEKIKQLPILLPPLSEQKQIVEILSLAEELIKKQKEAIALIDKILMAKFLEMFGDPATNPKGWEMRRLGEVAETATGGTPLRKKKEYWKNGTIPWIKSGELDDGFVYNSEEKITQLGLENSNAKLYPKGTLLMAMYGATAGKLGMLKIEASTNQAICAIFPDKDRLEKKYLWFYFLKTRDILLEQRFGGAQPNLSQDFIRLIRLPLPPIELQHEFAQIVEEFEKKREEMQKTLKTLESLFKLFQKKAFTGELTAEWREQNKVEWQVPRITARQAVLLASIYYHQNILQKPAVITMVMKFAFLLQHEAGLNLGYGFIPYKYGPFSKEVYEDIEELEKNLLVERTKLKKDVEMTEIKLLEEFRDWTDRIINSLPEEIQRIIKEYAEKYGKMDLNKLLDYVYAKYPEYTTKSKRKKEKTQKNG